MQRTVEKQNGPQLMEPSLVNDLPSFVNTPYRILQLDDDVTQRFQRVLPQLRAWPPLFSSHLIPASRNRRIISTATDQILALAL